MMGVVVSDACPEGHQKKMRNKMCVGSEGAHNAGDANGYHLHAWHHWPVFGPTPVVICVCKAKQNERM